MRALLDAARLGGAVLRVVGRHRAASAVGLLLAVGWIVFNTQRGAYAVGTGSNGNGHGDGLTGSLWLAGIVSYTVYAVLWRRRLRKFEPTLRDDAEPTLGADAAPDRVADSALSRCSDGSLVVEVVTHRG